MDETMRRKGFSPYGPSKVAVESETAIWAQDLADTGVTVNAPLPGGESATGMIPPDVPEAIRPNYCRPRSWFRLYFGSSRGRPTRSPASG